MNVQALVRNVRFWVLCFSVVLALGIYGYFAQSIPSGALLNIRLVEAYSLTALAYLYLALLIGPAVYQFRWLPWRGQIYRARRAIGFSAWGFACLHGYLAFFGLLGGFAGLAFLDSTYLWAISLSAVALVILTLMAATSFDVMRRKLGKWWKVLHRCVYVAGVLILIHALMLGSQFTSISNLIPQITAAGLGFLGLLEADRFDTWLERRFAWRARFGLTFLLMVSLIAVYAAISFFPASFFPGLNIHAGHLQQLNTIK